jgi:catechol 2,3-dioxygenase-like lactoylglutathione lyase family enzyme
MGATPNTPLLQHSVPFARLAFGLLIRLATTNEKTTGNKGRDIMAKIRHIAYRAEDVDAMAKFFVDAMGMTIKQKRKNTAVDLTDGTTNITVLPLAAGRPGGEPGRAGIDHIGFTVESEDEASRMLEAAGAHKIGRVELGSQVHYEVKYQGPEGIVVDVGNWLGTEPITK